MFHIKLENLYKEKFKKWKEIHSSIDAFRNTQLRKEIDKLDIEIEKEIDNITQTKEET